MDSHGQTLSSQVLPAGMADCLSGNDGLPIGVKQTGGRNPSWEDDLMLGAEASMYTVGKAHLTVTGYMRSLKTYLETPPLSAWDSSESISVQPTSITQLMKHWEADPVELLLDLGFGKEEPDITSRIPSRFINSSSSSKGINIRVFLEAQKERMSIENASLYGRFRQLEVLDQVTSAFSSLLSDVNTTQQKTLVEGKETLLDPEESKQSTIQGKRRRVCQLLRKASRQHTLMHEEVVAGTGNVGLIKNIEEHSANSIKVDRGKSVRKTKKRLSKNSNLALLAEEQYLNEGNTDTSSQFPGGLKGQIPVLACTSLKQSRFSSEIHVKDRGQKKSILFLTKTVKRASGLHDHPKDSFEMEEIQSFEEDTSRGNTIDNSSEMTRTNSCQSDSSGFLEEPLEPATLQHSLLPENLNISSDSSDSQSTLSSGMDSSYQDLKRDLSRTTNSVSMADAENIIKAQNLNKEDGGHGEGGCNPRLTQNEKGDSLYHSFEIHPDGFVKGKSLLVDQRKLGLGMEDDMDDTKKDSVLRCQASNQDKDLLFYRVHTFEESEGSLDENFKNKCRENIQQMVEGYVHRMEENSDHFYKGVPIMDTPLEKELCMPKEIDTTEMPSKSSEAHNANCVSSRSLIHSPGVSPKTHCQETTEANVIDILGTAAQAELKDSSQTSETSTNFFKSVTIQMSSDLTSRLQNAPLGDSAIKDHICEFPGIESENCEDEQVKSSRLGATEKTIPRKKDVSSQTDIDELISRNLCPHQNVLVHHKFNRCGTLTKSASFDTGLLGNSQASQTSRPRACAVKSSHSCHCCHCCCHYCCSLCGFPLPTEPTCCGTCGNDYTSVELELLRTLKVLQDSIRNISPCTVLEMEAMRKSCQRFRDQLIETEQLLFEQQAFLSGDFTNEGREEIRRLQVLRRAVHREVAELEFQLDDRTRQTKEGILMQLNQLLEEQGKLHAELEHFDWRGEGKAQNECSASNVLGTMQYPQSLATECSLSIAQQEDPQKTSADGKETKSSNQQKKGDFSTFLETLKKSFKNPFGSETAE